MLLAVETGTDSRARSVDLLEISQPNELSDIANLGLTLSGAKQLLARVQQAVVAAQAHQHAVLRPDCSCCGGRCQVKDWRLHQIATLFGGVTVRLPRFRCTGCGRTEKGVSWPSHCRSTPELDQLRAHLSAFMPYRVAAGVLAHLLPVLIRPTVLWVRGPVLADFRLSGSGKHIHRSGDRSTIRYIVGWTYVPSQRQGAFAHRRKERPCPA